MQWQRLLPLSDAKLRARLDKDSDLPLDEIWKTDIESEDFKDLDNAENQHKKSSLKMIIVLLYNMITILNLVLK
eukprot:15349302-Ditylum_brightwellii.AAC.1